MVGGEKIIMAKYKSRDIDKKAMKIMDNLQSYQIKAGRSSATQADVDALNNYAKSVFDKMMELSGQIENSDDPGSRTYYIDFLKRIERASKYSK